MSDFANVFSREPSVWRPRTKEQKIIGVPDSRGIRRNLDELWIKTNNLPPLRRHSLRHKSDTFEFGRSFLPGFVLVPVQVNVPPWSATMANRKFQNRHVPLHLSRTALFPVQPWQVRISRTVCLAGSSERVKNDGRTDNWLNPRHIHEPHLFYEKFIIPPRISKNLHLLCATELSGRTGTAKCEVKNDDLYNDTVYGYYFCMLYNFTTVGLPIITISYVDDDVVCVKRDGCLRRS